jgi:uncharacterized protein YjeT (DUF2065 family)
MRKLLCSLLCAALVITALLPFAAEAADKQVVTVSCASNNLVVVAANNSTNAPPVEAKECAQAIADALNAGLKLNNVGSVGTGFVVYTFIK